MLQLLPGQGENVQSYARQPMRIRHATALSYIGRFNSMYPEPYFIRLLKSRTKVKVNGRQTNLILVTGRISNQKEEFANLLEIKIYLSYINKHFFLHGIIYWNDGQHQ